MAVAAVAELVDGRGLAAADALLEHAEKTSARASGLRLGSSSSRREEASARPKIGPRPPARAPPRSRRAPRPTARGVISSFTRYEETKVAGGRVDVNWSGSPPRHRRCASRARLRRARRRSRREAAVLVGDAPDPRGHGRRADGRDDVAVLSRRRPADGAGAREPRLRPEGAPRAARSPRRRSRPADRARIRPRRPPATTTITTTTTTTTTHDHDDHDDARRRRRCRAGARSRSRARTAGDDGAARRAPRRRPRPLEGRERVHEGRPRRRPEGARPLRHRGRRPPARPPPQPPGAATTRSSSCRTIPRPAPRPRTPSPRSCRSTAGEVEAVQTPRRRLRPARRSPTGRRRSSTPPSPASACRTSGAARATARRPSSASRPAAATTAPGFVWRVYKLEPYPGSGTLDAVLRGRTTYQMSGEVPRSQRIGLAKLQPADVIFFGDQRPALAAGPGRPHGHLPRQRLVHPLVRATGSRVARLDGWYAREFAWGAPAARRGRARRRLVLAL